MLAGMQLDVFTPLSHGPLDAEGLAAALGVESAKLEPLLYALVTTGLLELRDGMFANGAEADRFLVRGRPQYMGSQHELYAEQWRAVMQTAETIRAGAPQAKHDFASMSADDLEAFYRGSHPGAVAAGHDIARRFDLSSRRALIDVGGGSGGVAIGVCEACPQLRATVADFPETTAITRRFVAESSVAERVHVIDADVVAAPPPGTYDIAVMRALVQILAPDDARRAVANVGRAIEPGGAIYITGNGIIDDSRVSPPEIVAFSLVYLNYYDGGRAYTEGEYRAMLGDGGFVDIGRLRLDGGLSIIAARKAGR